MYIILSKTNQTLQSNSNSVDFSNKIKLFNGLEPLGWKRQGGTGIFICENSLHNVHFYIYI